MTLETWLKIHTNVCNFVTAFRLKYFSVFLLNCEIRHASTTWKELIRKSLCFSWGDPSRWNGGLTERRNGMAEYTEYSKIRNIWNTLKHGIYGIFCI